MTPQLHSGHLQSMSVLNEIFLERNSPERCGIDHRGAGGLAHGMNTEFQVPGQSDLGGDGGQACTLG